MGDGGRGVDIVMLPFKEIVNEHLAYLLTGQSRVHLLHMCCPEA